MADYKLHIACSPYNSSDRRNMRVQIKCLPVNNVSDNSSVEDDNALDTAIFAYRSVGGELVFDHVCSTVDMVEYPLADNLVNGEGFKWCRSDMVDILVRTLSIAEDFITEVKSDVDMLYRNMKAHDRIVGIEEYIVE